MITPSRILAESTRPVKHSTEPALVQVWPIGMIRRAPENDDIYRAISVDDVDDLIRSIREHGIQEPLLVSSDGFIISGHRRWMAAALLDIKELPVRVHLVSRRDNPQSF
jgi:ParB-like nuclease family protein